MEVTAIYSFCYVEEEFARFWVIRLWRYGAGRLPAVNRKALVK